MRLELRYQSVEQLREDGLKIRPLCLINHELKTGRQIGVAATGATYSEAISKMMKMALDLHTRSPRPEGYEPMVVGIESRFSGNEVLAIGRLAVYQPI